MNKYSIKTNFQFLFCITYHNIFKSLVTRCGWNLTSNKRELYIYFYIDTDITCNVMQFLFIYACINKYKLHALAMLFAKLNARTISYRIMETGFIDSLRTRC